VFGAPLMRSWCVFDARLVRHKFKTGNAMDDKVRAILESIPKKRQRSKLEPYTDLIEHLRRRGHTYREIMGILAEKCGLNVVSSTLVRFRAAHSKEKRKRTKHQEARMTGSAGPPNIRVNISSNISDDGILKRIEALKQRPGKNEQPSKQFEYDPDQPLQLPHKD
jgi:hypothetical protein